MTESGRHGWAYWLRNGLGALALVLAVLSVVGAQINRGLQQQVDAVRPDLAKGQTFANIDNSLIRLLAKAAVEKNDTALRDLLARNGVTFKVDGAAPSAAAPAQPSSARP